MFALSITPPHVASFRKPAGMIDDGFIVWFPALSDMLFFSVIVIVFELLVDHRRTKDYSNKKCKFKGLYIDLYILDTVEYCCSHQWK